MHALEKILAHGAGVEKVKTGEILNCEVDIAGVNDLYLQAVYSFLKWVQKLHIFNQMKLHLSI